MDDATQKRVDARAEAERLLKPHRFRYTDSAEARRLGISEVEASGVPYWDAVGLLEAALEAAQRPPVSPEVREELVDLANDVIAEERDKWPSHLAIVKSEVVAGFVVNAILARFSLPSQPSYDVEKNP
jgi:hypothetical protein